MSICHLRIYAHFTKYLPETTIITLMVRLAKVLTSPWIARTPRYMQITTLGEAVHSPSVASVAVAVSIMAIPKFVDASPAVYPMRLNQPVKKDTIGLYFGRQIAADQ